MKKYFFMLTFLWLILSCSKEENASLRDIDSEVEFSSITTKINSSNFPIIYDIIDEANVSVGFIEIVDNLDNIVVSCSANNDNVFNNVYLYGGKYKEIKLSEENPNRKEFQFHSKTTESFQNYSFTIQKSQLNLDANECIYFSLFSEMRDTITNKKIKGWSSSQILPGTTRNKLVLYCVRNESIVINIP